MKIGLKIGLILIMHCMKKTVIKQSVVLNQNEKMKIGLIMGVCSLNNWFLAVSIDIVIDDKMLELMNRPI